MPRFFQYFRLSSWFIGYEESDMSEYDWRNASTYAYMMENDAEAFGREYLSRNEHFHREYMEALATGGEVTEAFAEKWGVRFRDHTRASQRSRLLDTRRLSARAPSRSDGEAASAERADPTCAPAGSRLPQRGR